MNDSIDNVESQSRGLRIWGVILVLSPLIYLLSVGPASFAHTHTNSVQVESTIEAIYYPLQLLYDSIPEFQPGLDWYVEQWE